VRAHLVGAQLLQSKGAGPLEQPQAGAEEDGHDVDAQLVDQAAASS
jgi:hypothetical protein